MEAPAFPMYVLPVAEVLKFDRLLTHEGVDPDYATNASPSVWRYATSCHRVARGARHPIRCEDREFTGFSMFTPTFRVQAGGACRTMQVFGAIFLEEDILVSFTTAAEPSGRSEF